MVHGRVVADLLVHRVRFQRANSNGLYTTPPCSLTSDRSLRARRPSSPRSLTSDGSLRARRPSSPRSLTSDRSLPVLVVPPRHARSLLIVHSVLVVLPRHARSLLMVRSVLVVPPRHARSLLMVRSVLVVPPRHARSLLMVRSLLVVPPRHARSLLRLHLVEGGLDVIGRLDDVRRRAATRCARTDPGICAHELASVPTIISATSVVSIIDDWFMPSRAHSAKSSPIRSGSK